MIASGTYNTFIMTKKSEVVRIGGYSVDPVQYPWLVDHIFQNVPVLPGSFIIDLAYGISRELYLRFPCYIRNLKFLNPVVLTSDITRLVTHTSRISTFRRKLFFSETDFPVPLNELNNISAEVELDLESDTDFAENSMNFNLFDFIKSAGETEPATFYSNLYKNGNQYENGFRNIEKIWSKDNRAAAKLKNINSNSSGKVNLIHPALLDSAFQLISLLSKNNDTAFVLDSIQEVKILNTGFQNDLWCCAEITPNQNIQTGFEGEAGIFNSSGDLCIQLSGVKFKYPGQLQRNVKIKKKVIIAANFTADPLEDSLRFWNEYFSSPFSFEFASYNQVYQQLLDPSGTFHNNQNGINVILLNPEEWMDNDEGRLLPVVTGEVYKSLLQNMVVYLLPNKMEIVHINRYETDYLYKEIFRDRCYQKHEITLNDNDTVIDVGANIGLFTLYVNAQIRNARVFSYEPSPIVFELLHINAGLYCRNTKVFNKGISDKRGKALFTFYPNSSVFSGFAADQVEDTEIISHVIGNILKDESSADDLVINNYVNEITGDRLKKETYECNLITVTDIIRENNLDKVDLLKIDAEKSELEILAGIEDEDWPKIKQIVIEIHDKTGLRLEKAKEILYGRGFHIDIDEETTLRESGLFNLYAKRNVDDLKNNDNEIINAGSVPFNHNIRQFTDALISFASHSSSPVIFGITPPSPKILSDERKNQIIIDAEKNLLKELNDIENIYTIPSNDFLTAFNVENYYDNTGREIGHIPYTPGFYASLGTTIFRKSFSLINSGCKVIVLDCDNTLWKGVCGEDGYDGIQITENYKFLQNFLIEQFNSGKLICLCSKNNEKDIDSVFDKRPDMILKKKHIISARINWNTKSENLKSIISELNLSPDSFVFIDDNPVECAEVRINCPEVITLNLPRNKNDIPLFLKNIWLFDIKGITEEDKKRTGFYKSNILRNQYKKTSSTLKDFINGLNLKISVTEADESQLDRAAQLTFRTNQFNFTTIRRNESEIRTLLNKGNYHCLLTEVSDRFGDYGITGMLLYSVFNGRIIVDTLLLSCRVFGKGVEYKILSELGKRGLKENIREVEIKYISSSKNKPALDFINSLTPSGRKRNEDALIFTFTPGFLSELKYEPDSGKSNSVELIEKSGTISAETTQGHLSSDQFQNIADELSDINLLLDKISSLNAKENSGINKNIVLPRKGIELRLSGIWHRVLGIKNISINDNFFDCGGTSLKAVQLIAEIKKEMNRVISIIDLFEYPTINSLAEKLGSSLEHDRLEIPGENMERGLRKRRILLKRKRIE